MAGVIERSRPADEELELAAGGSNAAVHDVVNQKHVVAMNVVLGGDSGRGGDDASGELTRVSIIPGQKPGDVEDVMHAAHARRKAEAVGDGGDDFSDGEGAEEAQGVVRRIQETKQRLAD